MKKAWRIVLRDGNVWFCEDDGGKEKVLADAIATFGVENVDHVEEY